MNEFPTKPKENAPHEAGPWNLGGPGRNRPGPEDARSYL